MIFKLKNVMTESRLFLTVVSPPLYYLHVIVLVLKNKNLQKIYNYKSKRKFQNDSNTLETE